MPGKIPDIPGRLNEDPNIQHFLSERVSSLCGLTSNKFPGSQPVSFTSSSLELLENMDFWVCEKSDGVRVLVFVVFNQATQQQEVWLIDRKQRFFAIEDLHFPHWEKPDQPLHETLLDGEMVIDEDPKTGVETLRLYAFDCLVLNGENIMQRPMVKRYGRLKQWVIEPWQKALKQYPEWRDVLPFDVVAKTQELSYHMKTVLESHIPRLQHGHDGLIFTCAESEYTPGTDEKILKWKPPSENSIDFKLELRFPPSPHSSEPDFHAKPDFLLHTWLGGHKYEYYDVMEVEDEEWESMKESGEQYDDRIVEVHWDTTRNGWRFMRIRDDKHDANHKSIMEKILISIEDGVEVEAILARTDSIRQAWKAREASRQQGGAGGPPRPPPGPQQQPQRKASAYAPQQQRPGGYPATPGGLPQTPGSAYPHTPGMAQTPGAPSGVLAGLKR